MSKIISAVLFLVLCPLATAAPSAWAFWVTDGTALCTAAGDQYSPAIVSDGSGGAIVAWKDYRSGSNDIYAQKVNASGTVLWTADGVALCTATGDQMNPRIVTDGAGGAIVTWWDHRFGHYDVYAQKVNASGAVEWTADGVALCTAAVDLPFWAQVPPPDIVSDGAGGAMVTWFDARSGSGDENIYVQRVNASGSVQWTTDGVILCAAAGGQQASVILSDGAGGAIVAWEDWRSGRADIYAQRVNASGVIQWPADGVPLCTATWDQRKPKIVSDGAGGAVIAWHDSRGAENDIYAQRVDSSGAPKWMSNGVALCTAIGDQWDPTIASDESGGAIVAWRDTRSGGEAYSDIYAQRVDASGTPKWTVDGEALCTAVGGQYYPAIVSDGVGGAIVTWSDGRGANDIYAQRINASGVVQWEADGAALCVAAGSQLYPTITSDDAGGAILAWHDIRSGTSWDIYAMRVNASGEPVATLLKCYSSSASDRGIKLTWTLTDMDADVRFVVLRATQGVNDYEQLSAEDLLREGLSFEFIDGDVESGATYIYRVDVQMGGMRRTLFETGPIEMPAMPVILYQNRPNPFNPSTVIAYYMPFASRVTLDILDSPGRLIACLIDCEERPKGEHTVEWRGVDAQGRMVSSGMYFYRLTVGKEMYSRKMILLK